MSDEEMVLVPRKPTRKMLRAAAKAMSPEKRPTQDWMSVSEKHAVRYNAMIEAYLNEASDEESATPSITESKPATFHKWVWFWQVGRYKVRGWQVEDRTLFKAKVWRELRLDDYIYGDGPNKMLGLSAALTQPLFADGSVTRIPSNWWKNRF